MVDGETSPPPSTSAPPQEAISIDTVSGRRLRHVLGEKIPWIPVSHPVHGRRVNHHTLPIPGEGGGEMARERPEMGVP